MRPISIWSLLTQKIGVFEVRRSYIHRRTSPHLEDSNFLCKQRPYRNWPHSSPSVRRTAPQRRQRLVRTRAVGKFRCQGTCPGHDEHEAGKHTNYQPESAMDRGECHTYRALVAETFYVPESGD